MQAMGPVSSSPRCARKGCSWSCLSCRNGRACEEAASYETDNYRADPFLIDYTDDKEPLDEFGFVFKFVGNVRDLSDGTFDLGTWLRRMKGVAEDSSDVT